MVSSISKNRSLLDLTFHELEAELVEAGIAKSHARSLWRAVHRDAAIALDDCEPFEPPLRKWISKNVGEEKRFILDAPRAVADTASRDGLTRKFLLQLDDGQTIETVLMRFRGRHTACVSTQAGCAMGCVFCATGQMGFARNLRAGEIVAQVLHTQRALRDANEPSLRNLVLMGMGEPLHNYDSVMTALEILSDSRGIGIAPSRITISTVGLAPAILRMAKEARPYHLAVSLHGTTNAERGALVPINGRWPIEELIEACRVYCAKTGRRIFFEWTLIAGTNDSRDHARRLGTLLRGIAAHVNLIPLNPTENFSGSPTAPDGAAEFQRALRESEIPSTIRQRRGIDVAAGCGQLRAEKVKRGGDTISQTC